MGAPLLTYNSNENEHNCVAGDLGTLLRIIDQGKQANLPHSYYSGHELAQAGEIKPDRCEYRKKDVAGIGSGNRTKNRVIVAVHKTTGKVVENLAYYWRHDNRVLKLSEGFFERAARLRNISI